MATNLEKQTVYQLSLYMHNLARGYDVSNTTEYLERVPQSDRDIFPSLLNCARIVHAIITNIETPPDTFFDEMWERIEAACLAENADKEG